MTLHPKKKEESIILEKQNKTNKKLYENKAAFFPCHLSCVQEHEIRHVRISMPTVVVYLKTLMATGLILDAGFSYLLFALIEFQEREVRFNTQKHFLSG